jgi:sugar transferase (PEP-CTERM/EpsH1 system associated)
MRAEQGLPADASAAMSAARGAPLIAHVIFRLDVGGLENGLVNLINRIPANRYRHAIICLTDYSDFHRRIQRPDVRIFRLNKPPGNSLATQFRLWRLLRELKPDIVHTRNLAALEGTVSAALAGVRARVHGEHGRDVEDLDGSSTRMQRVRRLFRPFVHHYVTVSRDLGHYLEQKIGVPGSRIAQIYNGVNSDLFHPADNGREPLAWTGYEGDVFVIGSVGRMTDVKDPLNLVRAFIQLLREVPVSERRLRLVMIGDGPLREAAARLLADGGLSACAWLPGTRDDVARVMRSFDLFVLPSLAEGISNTILEAMASGLPVLATAVGGNAELIEPGVTGTLVPAASPDRMAQALKAYATDPELCRRQGLAARQRVERRFGMGEMVNAYLAVYDGVLARRPPGLKREVS